jgi:hypothetical protein
MSAIHILLRGSIDYAGLFPPAELDMSTAVANFAHYGSGSMAWALGRFIVPAKRLTELRTERERLSRVPAAPWRIGVLLANGDQLAADLAQLDKMDRLGGGTAVIADAVEVKADTIPGIRDALNRIRVREAYIEVPINRDPAELLAVIGELGGYAKVRTGGVTPDAFPRSTELVRFLKTCVGLGLRFKATAGLHHPVRGNYRLTYSAGSPTGMMFGFLNVLLATAFLKAGMDEATATKVLEESSASSFRFDETGAGWRGQHLSLDSLQSARERGMTSFGSCSFTEPIDDLQELRLLAPKAQPA